MSRINQNLVNAVFGSSQDYERLKDKPVNKQASEHRGWSETRKQFFRDRLHENIVKKANEKLTLSPDLKAADPHEEYVRRARSLDKTGEEMQPRDVVLAAQAYHTLMNHARRELRLKG